MTYVADIEEKTLNNDNFREVLFTGPHSQLVVMTLLPDEEIGMEVHQNVDQFLRIEEGEGKAILDGQEYSISDGFAIVVPAGTKHNIINTSSDKKLKLYTIYSPAEHRDKTIHKTKQEALSDTEDHP
jgi:mannose-6-phosphate isomerase-like protein (cupin superfamily)